MKHLRQAIGFLTIFPVGRIEYVSGDLGRAALWFPLAGALIGVLTGAAFWAASECFMPLLSTAIAVAVWTALSGGLHVDGVGDCCDGLLASVPPERRLEIMRDPHIGAFGVIGIVLLLILKVAALEALRHRQSPLETAFLLAVPALLARWTSLLVAFFRPARASGLAHDLAAGFSRLSFALAGIIGAALIALGMVFLPIHRSPMPIIFAAFAALCITGIIIIFARARIGGVTGDVFGLAIEAGELSVLLVLGSRLV